MKKGFKIMMCATMILSMGCMPIDAQSARTEQMVEVSMKHKYWRSGMYKIGSDLPAGEYYLKGKGYWEMDADASGEFESILANDNIDRAAIVSVSEGQYLKTVGRIKIYTYGDHPKINVHKSGMFKVGVDLPAGEYQLVVDKKAKKLEDTGLGGYYEVSADATHQLESIIANGNFEENTYLSVSDGQYLKLSHCHISE